MPTPSPWSKELRDLTDPSLLENSTITEDDKDTLVIRKNDITIVYRRRISSWAIVVDVTVIQYEHEPMRRKEGRVAYHVGADAVIRQFWIAAVATIGERRSAEHDENVRRAVAAVKELVKPPLQLDG